MPSSCQLIFFWNCCNCRMVPDFVDAPQRVNYTPIVEHKSKKCQYCGVFFTFRLFESCHMQSVLQPAITPYTLGLSFMISTTASIVFNTSPGRNGITQVTMLAASDVPEDAMNHMVPSA
jgi:hypothetical protein